MGHANRAASPVAAHISIGNLKIKAMSEKDNKIQEVVNLLISLGKEDRAVLGNTLRKFPDAWNAVGGIGSPEEDLPDGRIEGLVQNQDKLEKGVLVKAVRIQGHTDDPGDVVKDPARQAAKAAEQNPDEISAETNEFGFYRLYLPVGTYKISFEKEGLQPVIVKGVLSITDTTDVLNAEMGRA